MSERSWTGIHVLLVLLGSMLLRLPLLPAADGEGKPLVASIEMMHAYE
jgi:hypothetical protein